MVLGRGTNSNFKRRVGKYSQNLKIRNTGSIRYEYVKVTS